MMFRRGSCTTPRPEADGEGHQERLDLNHRGHVFNTRSFIPGRYISGMDRAERRRRMTARIVPLASNEANDARVGGTVDERLALLAELSRRAWASTGKPIPSYTRKTMPVRITTLGEQ
jgi:hypothetical protein